MKIRSFLGLIVVPIVCAAVDSSARADILTGDNGFPIVFERHSNTGVPLNNPFNGPFVNEDILDCMTVDGSGAIFGVGHSVPSYELFRASGTTTTSVFPSQLAQATDIEFIWDHRLVVTSHMLASVPAFPPNLPQGQTGVLEFNPATLAFLQNLVPVGATYLGFSPQEANPVGFRTGTLYVGNDSGTTDRYRLTTGGAITKDTSFSIAAIGNTHFRSGDGTIYMENGAGGDSIMRFDPMTGSSLGSFVTLQGGKIIDFAFGDDDSVYVLGSVGQSGGVFHFGTDGSNLGLLPIGGVQISYISSVPEPMSLALLTCGLVACKTFRRNSISKSKTKARHDKTPGAMLLTQ